METKQRTLTLTPDLFEPIERSQADVERIGGEPIGFWADAWRRLKKNKTAMVSAVIIGLLVILAVVGPWLTSYTSDGQDLARRYTEPFTGGFWIGTDEFGRSMWDRLWEGTRVSLYIALLATALDLGIGMFYGAISAYKGGRVDNVMQRVVELLNGIPFLVIVILMMLIFEPGILSISIALGITGWVGTSRLIRGQVLQLKEQEFFLASRTLGANGTRLVLKHLIPNVFYIVIITLMFTVPSAIFSEAFLSFIGLGITPPDASLGALISEGAKQIQNYPFLLIYPCLVLCFLTICFRLLGDGLRDALDPKMRK